MSVSGSDDDVPNQGDGASTLVNTPIVEIQPPPLVEAQTPEQMCSSGSLEVRLLMSRLRLGNSMRPTIDSSRKKKKGISPDPLKSVEVHGLKDK